MLLKSGVNVIKLFSLSLRLRAAFDPVKHFQPILIFESNAGAYPSQKPGLTTSLTIALCWHGLTMPNALAY